MIKKLRKKFVCINMFFVTVVLVVIAVGICVSNYNKYQNDTKATLEQALQSREGDLKPKMEKKGDDKPPQDRRMTPAFTVQTDSEGKITSIDNSFMNVDEEIVENAVAEIISSGKTSGEISSSSLSYQVKATTSGKKIAFTDVSYEKSSLRKTMIIAIVAFIGGELLFLLISIYLAKWASKPVEKAWKQNKQFVADASHELKTPLTVILANLDIIQSHPNATVKEEQKWLTSTKTEAGRMKELLNDMLFLAKSDAATMPVVKTRFDFSNTVMGCVLPFESVAFENQIDLQSDIENDIFFEGDEKQMKQLIVIFLDNACKYGKGGKVNVHFYQKADKIYLSVNNTGETISKEDMEHIFERFYRADKSRARKAGGYGLGLSIASTIVQSHKGKIQVESTDEKGTTFTAILPK